MRSDVNSFNVSGTSPFGAHSSLPLPPQDRARATPHPLMLIHVRNCLSDHASERHAAKMLNLSNTGRMGHGLIDTMRIRMSLDPDTEPHAALGKAMRSLAQSALTGLYGDTHRQLRAAMLSSPDRVRGRLEEIKHRCKNSSTSINPDGHSNERIGAQAMAGIVCARLLNNATYAGGQPTRLGTSLSDWAGTSAADALIGKLVECESKGEVRRLLVGFVDMLRMGDLQLPKGRVPLLDEARMALEYCDSFDVSYAGHVLSTPGELTNLFSGMQANHTRY